MVPTRIHHPFLALPGCLSFQISQNTGEPRTEKDLCPALFAQMCSYVSHVVEMFSLEIKIGGFSGSPKPNDKLFTQAKPKGNKVFICSSCNQVPFRGPVFESHPCASCQWLVKFLHSLCLSFFLSFFHFIHFINSFIHSSIPFHSIPFQFIHSFIHLFIHSDGHIPHCRCTVAMPQPTYVRMSDQITYPCILLFVLAKPRRTGSHNTLAPIKQSTWFFNKILGLS